jgi:hypothetical protein
VHSAESAEERPIASLNSVKRLRHASLGKSVVPDHDKLPHGVPDLGAGKTHAGWAGQLCESNVLNLQRPTYLHKLCACLCVRGRNREGEGEGEGGLT